MKLIPLTQGKFAMVDDEDFEELSKYKWCYGKIDGYARTGKSILMHRVILCSKKGEHTDHISGNRLDNQKANLRKVTQQQNNLNKGIAKNNTTGFKGVVYDPKKRLFRARIGLGKKRIGLGRYKKVEDAAKAYKDAESRLYGEFARL